jgi:pimeloyl-ACP methyl ester carboxylesterase
MRAMLMTILGLACVLGACAVVPSLERSAAGQAGVSAALSTAEASLVANSPDGFVKDVDVGGRTLRISCQGSHRRTVLLEDGTAGRAERWAQVQAAAREFATVCSYDWANVGASDPAPSPRTSEELAADLYHLILGAELHQPLVVVGYAAGAIHASVFAARYPELVAGLVLVEPQHPDAAEEFLSMLPPPAVSDSPELQAYRAALASTPDSSPDGVDMVASAAQARAIQSLGAVPLFIFVAGEEPSLPGLRKDYATTLRVLRRMQQDNLLRLSVRGVRLEAQGCGQRIQQDCPEQIADVIRSAFAATMER